jgi:hypothetical protein
MAMTDLPQMSKKDLDIYLKSIENKIIHYKAQNLVKPDPYNAEQIKKLDAMAVEAMARFHEKDL